MRFQKKVLLIVLILLSKPDASVEFFPNINLSVDLGYFFLHKSESFHEKFMFESDWKSWITLFSAGEHYSLIFNPIVISGLSRSPYGLVFHPNDISYGLITYGEYKILGITFQFGLDHSCFHEIDKKENPTIYWNKLFTGFESPNKNEHKFTSGIVDSATLNFHNRISWSFYWGWYVRELFGWIEPVKIMTADIVNYHDFTLNMKYALWNRKNVVVSLTGVTMLGVGDDKSFYSRQITGLEINFKCNAFIGSFYTTYSLDQNWFDSRDKLLEVGARIAK